MQIEEVEIHEFRYRLEDVGQSHGHQVYEPGSILKPPGFVLTVRTTDGLEGYYRGYSFVKPMLAQIRMAAPEFLLGQNPLEREGIWQNIWRAFRHTDHLGLGPIDIALWDLAGKHYGASVAELLGGYRRQLPAYASTYFADGEADGLDSPQAFAAFAEECRDRGYRGYKLHGHTDGDPHADIELCRAVADAVGGEMDLMLDVASEYNTFADALHVGHALDDLEFYWYEDPLADTGQSLQVAKRLVEELRTPVLGLEHVRGGPFGRADYAVEGAADLVRVNAHLDGGITGAMKAARAVEALGLDVEFHVGGPAHLHCMSAVRNANYFEKALLHPCGIDWMVSQGFKGDPEAVTNGTVAVPEGPGLGVNIDWSFVRERLTDHTVIDTPGASGTA